MNPENKDEAVRNHGVVAKSPGTAGGVDTVYAAKHPGDAGGVDTVYAAKHPGSGGGVDTKSAHLPVAEIREPGPTYAVAYAGEPGGTAGTDTVTTAEAIEASGAGNQGPEQV